MAGKKKPQPPRENDSEPPSSETVRLPVDIMQMLRDIVHHDRPPHGRRYKLSQLAEELIRPALAKRHQAVMASVRQLREGQE